MSIRHLQTLVAVADAGSFRRAAEHLFLTQSAISMQMKALEREWHVELFDRSRRPPVLNSRGLSLVAQARRIIEEYEALNVRANSPESELVGSLRLGVIPSVTTSVLPKALLRLRRLYPRLRIRVESGLSQELSFKVTQGRLDAAVVTDSNIKEFGLLSRVIWQETLVLTVHRDLAKGSIPELLQRYPFIRFNAAMGVGRIIESAIKSRALFVDDAMELDSIEAICMMVSLKLGVAIIPENSIPARLRPKLATIVLPPPKATRSISLISRAESSDSPAMNGLFMQFKRLAPDSEGH